jgi:hypothetical protein
MTYNIGEDALAKLEEHPPLAAQATIRCWLSWCGPAYENLRPNLPRRVQSIARRIGFREIESQAALW